MGLASRAWISDRMSLAGAGRAAVRRAATRMRSVESCILKLPGRACNSRKCGLSMYDSR
jgi:hypothetical protein